MNARLFRYVSVGAMLTLSLGSALPTMAATAKPVSPAGPAPASGPSMLPPVPGAPAVIGSVIYDGIPSPQPPNVPSLGFQATQTAEFGDHVIFAGSARKVTKVTVFMSTWAKQVDYPAMTDPTGWTHPITIKLYNVNNAGPMPAPGALIATVTTSFKIPWRPVADPSCTGLRWKAGDGNCYNGFGFPITFDLTNMNVTLPNEIIYGISYNTQTYGASPLGVEGPYNSLNVGVDNVVPGVGTDVNPDVVFWNTSTAAWYTDGGAAGVGIFRFDTNWSTQVPNARFEAISPAGLVINPSTTYVASGATFGVDLAITDANDMSGYQFTLNYPPAMATGAGTGSYIDTDFDTTEVGGGVRGTPGLCWAAGGTCEFAAARLGAIPGFNGPGTLAHVGFTANTPGVYTLSYTGTILSDADLHSLPVTLNTAVVNVYGTGTINGVVKLQGRPTPLTGGTITMVDVAGLLPNVSGTFDAAGNYSIPVPALVAGTTWRITADHALYLKNTTSASPLTDVTVVSGGTAYASPTTLKGGNANSDITVSVTDLSCIAGDFGGVPTMCNAPPLISSDVNGDGIVNVFDLVMAGGNFGKSSPQPWQ